MRLGFDLELDLVGLEGEEKLEQDPCDEDHHHHVRNHPGHPGGESDLVAGVLQGADCDGVGRGADRGADTSEVGGDGDGEREAYLSGLILGECLEHGSQERQHHGCGGGVAHEHGEHGDNDEEAEKHHLGLLAEQAEEALGDNGVHTVFGGYDCKHEAAHEQHDDGVGE